MSVELAAIGAGVEIANRAVDIGGKVVNIVEDGLDRNQERGIEKTKRMWHWLVISFNKQIPH